MAEYSSYMWSVPDWRTDEMYTLLDNREQGVYRNLIDECWVAGSIDSSLEILARFSKEPMDYFLPLWAKIHRKFRTIDGGKRLISARLEQDRRRFMLNAKFTEKRARKAANVRWAKERAEKELHANSIAQASPKHAFKQCQTQTQTQTNETSSPLLGSPNTEKPPTPIGFPPAEKRGGRRDKAADLFSSAYREHIGNPYGWLAGDFEQLAKLRKRLKIATLETPDGWEAALENYFASPMREYSLHHFAAKFDTFKNSRLDRYKTPVSHANGGGNGQRKSKADITRENGESVLRDLADHENRGRG